MPLQTEVVGEHVVAQVGRVSARHAEVSVQKNAVCGSCNAACGARLAPQPAVRVTVRNPESLSAGRAVFLAADPGALARISLLLYLFPAAGFVAGAYCAKVSGFGDLLQGGVGLLALVAGLWLARQVLEQKYSAGAPLSAEQIHDK